MVIDISLILDGNVFLVPFQVQGVTVNSSSDIAAHAGFLMAYNSVASIVLEILELQVSDYWDYTVISTGMVILLHAPFNLADNIVSRTLSWGCDSFNSQPLHQVYLPNHGSTTVHFR